MKILIQKILHMRVGLLSQSCPQHALKCLWRISAKPIFNYRISSYSFRGNYSFLNMEIQRSQYKRPKVTVHKGAETIQGRKLFKGGNYMRKYGIQKCLKIMIPCARHFVINQLFDAFFLSPRGVFGL